MSEEDGGVGEHLTLFERNFYLVNGLVGSVLNAIVLFIALCHVDTYDKPRQIIVINMTFADLMVCLVYMLTRPYVNMFPEFLCFPYYIVICTCQLCSCMNLLWLNIDKFIFIKRPLHYYTIVSRARIIVVMIATWLAIIGIAIGVYSTMEVMNACNLVNVSPTIYSVICVLYVLSIVCSFAISLWIYFIAKNSRKMEPRARLKMFQRLFFLFSSTLWTFVTCLPYRILYLIYMICSSCLNYPFVYRLTDTFFSILVVGIVINPLITVVTQRLYRHHVFAYYKKIRSLFVQPEDSFDSTTNFTSSSYIHRSSKPSTIAAPTTQEIEKLRENTDV